jgi:hypothetical protein
MRGMSMSLALVKVPAALGERIRSEPDLLNQIWEEEELTDPELARLDLDSDRLLEDYLGLSRVLDDQPDRFPWMTRALNGTGDEVDFEFGYGNGFVIGSAEAARIAAGLGEEGWWRPGDEIITIDHAIAAFYMAAAEQDRTVIGGVC